LSLLCQPLLNKLFFVTNDCCFIRFLRRYYPFGTDRHKKISRMFEKLRQKWKVNVLQLVLILCTFAIGGSLTGYAAKKIINLLPIESDWLWTIIYILLVTIIWPIMVLIISLPFGQFRFFSNYTRKLGQKIGLIKSEAGNQTSDVKSEKL
jgi:branched-subunit amino acid transport protein AzlD